MIKLRKAVDRGYNKIDWLESWHSFSFADYYDPDHMGFRDLRVINEDIIQPDSGFGTHGHRDMEIVTYVMDGELQHKDSTTNEPGVIKHGEVQRMSAGKGILHSEYNESPENSTHLFQIWILPAEKGIKPGYEQKKFAYEKGKLQLICSPDARDGSLKIHQDVEIYRAQLGKGEELKYTMKKGRHAWLQMADGKLDINGLGLDSKDAAAISDEKDLTIRAEKDTEFLLFNLT